jgi:hypothetical protein
MSPVAASGSKITLSRQAASASLSEIAAGTGLYTLGTGASLAIEKGQTYLLTIDADGDGSIDGRGTVSVVGDLALTQPTPGGSYLASSFTASWTDTGTSLGGATYSAVYFLAISGRNATTAFSYQFGSGLSFTPYDLLGGPGTPLPPGDYTATLTGYSGFASSGSQNLQQSNNITGVGLTGTALSFDSVSSVDFTLR